MKFLIVFDNSGDTIPFVALNPNVVEYYVENLMRLNLNSFSTADSNYADRIDATISKLDRALNESNSWLSELIDQKFNTFAHEDYLDQSNLNYLHAAWVGIQNCVYDIDQGRKRSGAGGIQEHLHDIYSDEVRFPRLGDVINKIGKKQCFDSINVPLVHGLESSFTNIIFKCSDNWVEFHNPFSKSIINHDTCNLFLPFNHLGRTQYDKFKNFDFDFEYDDENTFNELLGFVGLSLIPPQTNSYSNEYITWCKSHNREPSGESFPLGNIPDLVTNLKKYRIMVFNNTKAGNKFRIVL